MNIVAYLLPVGMCLTVSLGQPRPEGPARFSKTYYRLGDRLLTLERAGRVNDPAFTIVSWEARSPVLREQATTFAQANEGRFIHLEGAEEEGFEVELLSKKLLIHPDRVFTYEGQRKLLREQDSWRRSSFFAVQKFSRFLIDEIFTSERVILLGAREEHTLNDYQKGGRLSGLAREVHAGSARIGEGFVCTSDEDLFRKLQEKNLPVVLLSKMHFPDDGSLMKFCLRRNLSLVQLLSNDPDPLVQQQWLEVISR